MTKEASDVKLAVGILIPSYKHRSELRFFHAAMGMFVALSERADVQKKQSGRGPDLLAESPFRPRRGRGSWPGV